MKLHLIAIATGLSMAASAQAAPAYWNTWASTVSGTISTPGGPVTVTYSGDTFGAAANYPSYTPSSTFADGTFVGNAPVAANGILQLQGGASTVNSVTFSSPVTNPVMAIWSLGQGYTAASFDFIGATPVLRSGGPSAEYSGASISVSGNTVWGNEGNGTVQFMGTFTSLKWTNPQYEFWYGFNVGTTAPVPEPTGGALMLAGLVTLAISVRSSR